MTEEESKQALFKLHQEYMAHTPKERLELYNEYQEKRNERRNKELELKREKIKTPIIILTAKSEIDDKLNGLENGADDYITKPFHMKELLARVKIILKRNLNIEDTNYLTYGDLTLDLSCGKLKCKDNEVSINGKELNLIEMLLINKGQIVEKEVLTDKIWGYDSDAEYNSVEVYVSFLRKKIDLLKSNAKISTVRGIGYKLEAKND